MHDHGDVGFLLLFLVVVVLGAIALGTVLIVALTRAGARAERRRLDALYAWTMANGWQLVEGDVGTTWRHRLAHLSRFGIRRLVHSVVHGLPVTAADCHYTSHSTDGNGNSQSTVVGMSVFVARLPGRWPDVEVRGRHLGSRLMRALGRQSPIETGHPVFDQKFSVVAMDPHAARSLLTPALVDAHLRGQAPPWSLQGGELMLISTGRLNPEGIRAEIERLGWLAEMLGYRA
jgi:hypothetical protein